MSQEHVLNLSLDEQFESLDIENGQPSSGSASDPSSTSSTSSSGLIIMEPVKPLENNKKRRKDKNKSASALIDVKAEKNAPSVISQQPTKQQPMKPNAGRRSSKEKVEEDKLIQLDDNCFLNEDILQQQQAQFAQYEKKVRHMKPDEEDELPPRPAGEQHHQQHPQQEYEYKENILLINELEQMQVSSPEEFCEKLGFTLKDPVKNR